MPLRTPCFNKYVVGAKIRTISDIPKYFLCFYRLIANYSLIGDSFIQLKNISDSCNDTVQMFAASRMAILPQMSRGCCRQWYDTVRPRVCQDNQPEGHSQMISWMSSLCAETSSPSDSSSARSLHIGQTTTVSCWSESPRCQEPDQFRHSRCAPISSPVQKH